MSKRGNREFLRDIEESIERIMEYTVGMIYEEFINDTKTHDAVIRNLEIIGEAVKNLSKDLKSRYKEIGWKDIAGMRDKIIHIYFGVKWDIVWSVIKVKLPELKAKLHEILRNEKSQD